MKSLVGLALPVLAASAVVERDNAPPAFKLNNVIYGGSGCPQGSIDIKWTDSGILPICMSHFFSSVLHHLPRPTITDSTTN